MRERLDSEKNLWFTTVRPDGRPHLVPIWFVHVDDDLWICTGARAVKVRNLEANPAVSIALESGDRPVVGEGRATLLRSDFPRPVVDAFVAKFDWDITEDDPGVGDVVLIRISVTRWLFSGTVGG
jgi:PPOX class probable F420-dependent enzyme